VTLAVAVKVLVENKDVHHARRHQGRDPMPACLAIEDGQVETEVHPDDRIAAGGVGAQGVHDCGDDAGGRLALGSSALRGDPVNG
jgi:hypothetical protein